MSQEPGDSPRVMLLPREFKTEVYLSDIAPEQKPWEKHRGQADEVRDQLLTGPRRAQKLGTRIGECGQSLEFGFMVDDSGTQKLRLKRSYFCRVRHCPVCQWRRSLMWQARFYGALPDIQRDYPTAKYIFLTLTVQNCHTDTLKSTLKEMSESWGRLVKRKEFKPLGWLRALEITKGRDGLAHPHYHALLMVPASYFSHGYMTQAVWTQIWKECLRANYTPIVNVKTVKPKKSATMSQNEAIWWAIKETIKYTVKPEEMATDHAFLMGLVEQLKGVRAMALGGVFKAYIKDKRAKDKELVNADGEAGEENPGRVYFGWREHVKHYQWRP